jgi:hypothetical protein
LLPATAATARSELLPLHLRLTLLQLILQHLLLWAAVSLHLPLALPLLQLLLLLDVVQLHPRQCHQLLLLALLLSQLCCCLHLPLHRYCCLLLLL